MRNFIWFHSGKSILGIKRAASREDTMQLVYAKKETSAQYNCQQQEYRRELEKLKGSLQSFIRESIKKQLKEERDYYKSRPAQAAKYYGDMLGQGLKGDMVDSVTEKVYSRMENHMRYEWVRRGR